MHLDKTITPEANMLKLLNRKTRAPLVASDFVMPTPETITPPNGETANTQLTVRFTNPQFPGLTKVRYTRPTFAEVFPTVIGVQFDTDNFTTFAQLKAQVAAVLGLPETQFNLVGSMPKGGITEDFTIAPLAGDLVFSGAGIGIKVRNTSQETKSIYLDVSNLAHGITAIPNRITNVLATIIAPAMVSNLVQRNARNTISMLGNGYITFPATEQHDLRTGDFTIEYWYNNAIATNNYVYMGQVCTESPGYIWSIQLFNGRIYVYFGSASTASIFSPVFAYAQGTWTHLALCRKGQTLRLFVNGAVLATYTIPATVRTVTPGLVRIGHVGVSGTGKWAGYIDDFKIDRVGKYDAAFTPI